MKYNEIKRKLNKLGCKEIPRKGKGSHRKWYNPKQNLPVPVPDWGSKDLKIGTIKNIVKLLDLNWTRFSQA
jgi:predicted RNA binding protein YcfA (HicA-like mRNA interferase family)